MTHIISSGVAGVMAGSEAGVRRRITAWVATLPATTILSGGQFRLFTQTWKHQRFRQGQVWP